ncbi:TraR/DksA C4-type zinc finger protein [Microbacterium sp.]|uniref:TraR/DksA family transcriptional regulator n=1 Tax=Microbacterium sp. TaxID=51671 RepID=UPI0032215CB7
MTQDERLRSLLLAQQERTRIRVERLAADLDALTSARRGESDDDEHDPEGVTLSSQWSMLAGLLESARDEDRQTEEAMRRLDAGTYGVCVVCGRAIPLAQLEVRPFRDRCVACAERR